MTIVVAGGTGLAGSAITRAYQDTGASVKDFAEVAFARAGLNWNDHTVYNEKYIRPTEVDALIGDPSKIEKAFGWKAKTHWRELAELMVDSDLASQEI